MRLLLVTTVLSCAVLALGCPKKKGEGADAAADAAVEAEAAVDPAVDAAPEPAAPVVVNAKNIGEIARFPAETPVTDDDAKLAQTAQARTSPKTGAVVATLKPTSDVNKIAEYQGAYLVTFADPKDANVTLMGWIGKESFTAPTIVKTDAGVKADAGVKTDAGAVVVDAGAAKPDAGPAKLACATGQVPVVLSKDPVCKKKCTKDADCKTGACANATGQAGGVFRVCASE